MIEVIFHLLGMVVVLSIPVLIFSRSASPLFRSARNFIPQPAPVRGILLRLSEILLLAGMAVIVLLLLVYERCDVFYVPAVLSDHTPADVRTTLTIGVGIGLLTIVATAVIAWRKSTAMAAGTLGAIFAVGALAVNVVRSNLESEAFRTRDNIENLPMLRFEVEDCPEGGDILINGISLGKTPLTISAAELFEKIPT